MVALNKKPKKQEHPPDNVSAISVAVKEGSTEQGEHKHVYHVGCNTEYDFSMASYSHLQNPVKQSYRFDKFCKLELNTTSCY